LKRVSAGLSILALAGCVPVVIPRRGTLETVTMTSPTPERAPVLNRGERVVVLAGGTEDESTCAREVVGRMEPSLPVVPAREFRLALFPWFDLDLTERQLAAVFTKSRVRDAITQLKVRYVIAIEMQVDRTDAYWTRDRMANPFTNVAADIWDPTTAAVVGTMTATAKGSESGGILLPFTIVGSHPVTRGVACEALGDALGALFVRGVLPPRQGDRTP